jgi:hypothetical protein
MSISCFQVISLALQDSKYENNWALQDSKYENRQFDFIPSVIEMALHKHLYYKRLCYKHLMKLFIQTQSKSSMNNFTSKALSQTETHRKSFQVS